MSYNAKTAVFVAIWLILGCWLLSCSEKEKKQRQKKWTQRDWDEYHERMEYRSMRGE